MADETVQDFNSSPLPFPANKPRSPRSETGNKALLRLLILVSVPIGLVVGLASIAPSPFLITLFTVFDAFFTWVITRPGISLPISIMFLILYNLFGSSFGLSKLFLSQRASHRFWSAVFVVLLTCQAIMCTFYTSQPLRTWRPEEGRQASEAQPSRTWKADGTPQASERLIMQSTYEIFKNHGIFLSSEGVSKNPSKRILIFFLFVAPPLFIMLLIPGVPIELFEGRISGRSAGVYPPWLNPADCSISRERVVSSPSSRFLGWLLGLIVGAALVEVSIFFSAWLYDNRLGTAFATAESRDLWDLKYSQCFHSVGVLAFYVLLGLLSGPIGRKYGLLRPSSSMAIILLLALPGVVTTDVYTIGLLVSNSIEGGGLAMSHLSASALAFMAQVGVLAIGVAWVAAVANSREDKRTFPMIERHYQGERSNWISLIDRPGAPSRKDVLCSTEVIQKWADLQFWEGTKPKLAVVAVSGGAMRSAVWTSLVLARIEERLAKEGIPFGPSVRIITGASGGMLGAAGYVASFVRPDRFGLENSPVRSSLKHHSIAEKMWTESLRAVAVQTALFDVPSAFFPFRQRYDRGRALEDTWPALEGITFGELRAKERMGIIPSLLFSPMLVEDGRRLLISNLDVHELTRVPADRAALFGDDERHQCLSRSAVEFSALFPDDLAPFRVSTAVRMSASFPLISPSVCLPTNPTRTVVDAGYYDNFGVNLACDWIRHNADDLTKYTSGVVLIQIRDHAGQQELNEFKHGGSLDRLGRGLLFLTSPLAGMMQARNASMAYRNDTEVAGVAGLLQQKVRGGLEENGNAFFKTAIFEFQNAGDVAMTWRLSTQEVRDLNRGIDHKDGVGHSGTQAGLNNARLERLVAWWTGNGGG